MGSFKASKGRQSADAANLVHVQIQVFRLPSVDSDVVMTMTTPVIVNEASACAPDVGAGTKTLHHAAPALFQRVTTSVRILDWGLFGTTQQS